LILELWGCFLLFSSQREPLQDSRSFIAARNSDAGSAAGAADGTLWLCLTLLYSL
jgi:hypothetical protein